MIGYKYFIKSSKIDQIHSISPAQNHLDTTI